MRKSVSLLAVLTVMTALSSIPALAQATTPAARPNVDESALRYFARQGDQKRLEAEIARLSAIYPGWEPPADPLADDTGIDEELQKLWDIYGTGDIAALHEAITARQQREPGWSVPKDLADALRLADARTAIVTASDAGNDDQVLALAATYPQLLECDNVDTLWRLGQAFVDSGRDARGIALYSYILQNCQDSDERLATMQKAAALLGMDGIQPLFAFEKQVGGKGEFGAIRVDAARQNVADALNGISSRANPEALTMLKTEVEATPSVNDLQLLGYYDLDQGQVRTARDWFRKAYDLDANVDTATALSIALMQFGDAPGAEATLAPFRSDTPESEQLYLDAASSALTAKPLASLDTDALTRISEAVTDARDAKGAHDLGWYAYGFKQYRTAAQWFEAALAFDPSMESAAYGLVVTSNQLRDTARIRELQQDWGDLSPRIRLFGRPNAPTEAPARYDLSRPSAVFQPAVFRMEIGAPQSSLLILTQGQTQDQIRAAGQCGTFVPPETIAPNAALGRAWCLMGLNRDAEAEATFRRATLAPSGSARTEAYYGLALALLRLGLPNDASVAASAMPQTPERERELQVAILADSAVAATGNSDAQRALDTIGQN